jgi:ribosome-associated heat shock protein Hsp15
MSEASLRLDKLLWFLRLAKTRGAAQERVAAGHIRLNGKRVERSAQPVAPGDVLTLPLGSRVAVIEVLALPARRGPAPEAQGCYRALDAGPRVAIALATAKPLTDPLGNHDP